MLLSQGTKHKLPDLLIPFIEWEGEYIRVRARVNERFCGHVSRVIITLALVEPCVVQSHPCVFPRTDK